MLTLTLRSGKLLARASASVKSEYCWHTKSKCFSSFFFGQWKYFQWTFLSTHFFLSYSRVGYFKIKYKRRRKKKSEIEKVWVDFAGITEPCSWIDAQTSENLMAYQYIKSNLTAALLLQYGSITFISQKYPA